MFKQVHKNAWEVKLMPWLSLFACLNALEVYSIKDNFLCIQKSSIINSKIIMLVTFFSGNIIQKKRIF